MEFVGSITYGLPKKRKVLALRDFPQGCGPCAIKKSIEESTEFVSSSVVKDLGLRCRSPAVKLATENCTTSTNSPTASIPAVFDKIAEEKSPVEDKCTDKEETSIIAHYPQHQPHPDEQCEVEINAFRSILYGPAKRRKVTAIRDFPQGCGTAYDNISTDQFVADTVSHKEDILFDTNPAVDIKPLVEHQGVTEVVSNSCSLPERSGLKQVNNVIKVSTEPQVGSILQFSLHKHASEEVNVKKKSETEPCTKTLRRTQESDNEVQANISSKGLNLLCTNEEESSRQVALPSGKGGDREYVKEYPDNSVPKNDLREKSMKELVQEMVSAVVPSGSKMGIMCKKNVAKKSSARQAHKSLKKSVSVTDASMLRKSRNANHAQSKSIQKVSCSFDSQEESDKQIALSPQKEDNIVYKTCDDKVIVLALMAASNCPWRRGRHSHPGNSSALSEGKTKKEKKVSNRKRSSTKTPSKFEESCALDNQYLPLALYEENENVSSSLYGSRELTVMLPPSVPIDSNHYCGGDGHHIAIRNRVRRTLRLFQVICRKLLQEEESKSRVQGKAARVDLKAAEILKHKNEWINTGEPIVGLVPGVEIGDEFHYRVELAIIGLHRPFQGGIDRVKREDNTFLATSIVAGGTADEMDGSDVLIYSGSGGSPGTSNKPPEDQKLEMWNLSLKNSVEAKTPVRVIRCTKDNRKDSHDGKARPFSTFVYDGLYVGEKYWKERFPQGFLGYKFQLRRIPGQPELALKEVKKSRKSALRQGICIKDISGGKERIPISAVNTVDDEQPLPFTYINKIMHPSSFVQTPPRGCNCTDACSDSENCACAVKNGGEIPYNYNGAIVQAKPLVYECGPSCRCPPNCHNRVSQHGIKIQLEVFKTKSMGWGVRSLDSISSGSYICEYIGELLPDREAEKRDNDEYLFDIGNNYEDSSLWEGLPAIIPDMQSSSPDAVVKDSGFTIDASSYGNVGRFINHSCSPNLYAQNVLYDQDDRRMPHIMFFAAENIPPLQELTYHYNYMIGQVRDAEGNVKRKDCHCGSDECEGRLY